MSAALVRCSLPRSLGRALVLLAALLLSACETELYNNLDQRQATRLSRTLQQRGIPAQRVAVKGGTYTVVVDKGRFAAVCFTILKDAGLPGRSSRPWGKSSRRMVSSPRLRRSARR